MDFNDSAEEADFRAAVRAWLARNAGDFALSPTETLSDADLVARGRGWQARKAEGGYAAILWPKEVEGRGGTPMQQVIFDQEESKYPLPTGPFSSIGLNMGIPVIRAHGTAEQLQRFAGSTLRGEIAWCQLFSEPAAGSDLAAVRTRAVRDGEQWIVNGQKVWSSWAHQADWGLLLARTDPTVPKHKGLTFFLIHMKSPGIAIRPIRQISGKSDFNEVFLTDVCVPDSNRIGAIGEGWKCAMTTLMNERLGSGEGAGLDFTVEQLMEVARQARLNGSRAIDNPAVRDRLAYWYAQERGLHFFRCRMITRLSKGSAPGAEAGLAKLIYARKLQDMAAYAMDLHEMAGGCSLPNDAAQRLIQEVYLWSAAMRIAAGSDEILRNQLAERVLGMPTEIRVDKEVPFEKLQSGR
jgi:alkylation response protein AidB-like acyl-CoA dehydrogenase